MNYWFIIIHTQYIRCAVGFTPLYFGVAITAFLLQSYIWITFIIIAFTMWRNSCKAVTVQYPTTTRPKEMKKNAAVLCTLSILFGLPWIVIFLAIPLQALPSVGSSALFVFVVIDLLQGPMLFLVQGVRLSEIRKLWRRWLCCKCHEVDPSLKIHASQNSLKFIGV